MSTVSAWHYTVVCDTPGCAEQFCGEPQRTLRHVRDRASAQGWWCQASVTVAPNTQEQWDLCPLHATERRRAQHARRVERARARHDREMAAVRTAL